jgi:hypothetical protein
MATRPCSFGDELGDELEDFALPVCERGHVPARTSKVQYRVQKGMSTLADIMDDRKALVLALWGNYPNGACFDCLAMKAGMTRPRSIEAVNVVEKHIVIDREIRDCPACSSRQEIIRRTMSSALAA